MLRSFHNNWFHCCKWEKTIEIERNSQCEFRWKSRSFFNFNEYCECYFSWYLRRVSIDYTSRCKEDIKVWIFYYIEFFTTINNYYLVLRRDTMEKAVAVQVEVKARTQKVVLTVGKVISWRYIKKLHELQNDEFLNVANKLKKAHLEWWKHKMKVSCFPDNIPYWQ